MKVLVTGSAGFIGGRTLSALKRAGHHVAGMDRREGTSTADFDTLDRVVAAFRPALLVHMGASCSTRLSWENPRRDFADNAAGTLHVAEVARTHGNLPVLYTSSVKVAPGADGLVAPLGLSKRIGEDYLLLYRRAFGLPVVILQPSTVYGPGQLGDRNMGWVGQFVRCSIDGSQVTVQGTGEQTRDVLFIDDFVRLVLDVVARFEMYAAGGPDDCPVYPVGGGPENEISLLTLLQHLGMRHFRRAPALPSDLDRVVTDNGPVSAVNGWAPLVGWVEGVERTRAWWKGGPR